MGRWYFLIFVLVASASLHWIFLGYGSNSNSLKNTPITVDLLQLNNLVRDQPFKKVNRVKRFGAQLKIPIHKMNFYTVGSVSPFLNTNRGSGTSGARDFGGYGDSESLQGILLRQRPLEQLAQLIMGSMSYHQVLVDNDLQGAVSLNIGITPDLRLAHWDKPSGDGELLKAFVLVSILNIFRGRESEKSEGLINVKLNFQFRTQFVTEGPSEKFFEIVDPQIYFNFISFRHPQVVRWMLENMPLIPIPGGIMINVFAVVKIIEDWEKVSPETRREQIHDIFRRSYIDQADRLNQ